MHPCLGGHRKFLASSSHLEQRSQKKEIYLYHLNPAGLSCYHHMRDDELWSLYMVSELGLPDAFFCRHYVKCVPTHLWVSFRNWKVFLVCNIQWRNKEEYFYIK